MGSAHCIILLHGPVLPWRRHLKKDNPACQEHLWVRDRDMSLKAGQEKGARLSFQGRQGISKKVSDSLSLSLSLFLSPTLSLPPSLSLSLSSGFYSLITWTKLMFTHEATQDSLRCSGETPAASAWAR
jgi:hypothetical protein